MKRRFNQSQRLKADARMSSRALNTLVLGNKRVKEGTSYGVNEKSIALKRNFLERLKLKTREARSTFKKSKSIKQTVKTFLRVDLTGQYRSGFLSDEMDGVDRGQIKIIKKRGNYYKNRKDYRGNLIHELVHSMNLPKNNFSANAFQSYFKRGKIQTDLSSETLVKNARRIKIALKESYFSEHEINKKGLSQANVGEYIGDFAVRLETKLDQPGLGIIYIREVMFGKDPVRTISKISKGHFNHELVLWKKANPRFAKLLK